MGKIKCKQCGKETSNKSGLCSEKCIKKEEALIKVLVSKPLVMPF